ncbi:retinoblastoma-associated protein-like [Stegodyphus dumicola]|uniref:retinoblastoma-associated protein-like n=1 Tax=Stegodyphus dumicola TaxID=202533 RepID=UPI0015A9B84C|nr:retinoblastoma-associated protein-like [Stegodyphus dumicola]
MLILVCSTSCKYQSVSVRRILDTADALNTILLSASDDVSENLKYCFQKCTVDASANVKKFVSESEKIFIGAFLKSHEGSDKTLAERRYKLASRYYYIMLDALLKKESESLEPSEFSSFLQNDVFHKTLLACCLEVTLMSCGSVGSVNFTPVHGGDSQVQGIVFPWILQVFNLEAFHFFKIIESFIRGAPTITPEIVKHLKETEDKILESLAWQTGSSVFGGLSGTGCSPSCRAKYASPGQTSSFWSPNKDPSQNFSTTPHTCHAVNIFLNKVSRLAYQRFENLCEMLQILKETKANIWTCIEHVIYKKSHLLRGRHIDQIIMCCIFAICKVMEQEVRFKTIVSCYGQLSHSSVSVYKQVLSEGEKKFITVFYNKEFNSEMKDYIISHFWNKSKTESSTLNTEQSPFALSPAYSILGKKNIFVTPMQKTSFKNAKEIIYQRLPSYSFGSLTQCIGISESNILLSQHVEKQWQKCSYMPFQNRLKLCRETNPESPKMLQNINDSLNVLQPAAKNVNGSKGKKRLHFGAAEELNRKVAVNSARKFLCFDQPACSKSSLTKPKSGDREKKSERFNKST